VTAVAFFTHAVVTRREAAGGLLGLQAATCGTAR
jgi:hypothetical protein